jgi:hypothetical protein
MFSYAGLYPEIQKTYNIIPDPMSTKEIQKRVRENFKNIMETHAAAGLPVVVSDGDDKIYHLYKDGRKILINSNMENNLILVEEPYVSLKVMKVLNDNGFPYTDNKISYSLIQKWIEVNFHFHISTSPRSWEEDVIKWSVWVDELKLHHFLLAVSDENGDYRDDDPYDSKEEAIEAAILFIFRHLKNHFEKLYIKEGKE